MQDADREQRVLVDRVVMVHVVLHLRDDAAEIGNEAAEHAGLVHAPQGDFRVLLRGQDFEEQAIGLGILAQPGIDQAQGLRHRAQRARVDVEVVLLGDVKEPQQRDRVLLEKIVRWDRQPIAVEPKAVEPAPRLSPAQPRQPAFAFLVDFEDRAEDAGQIADILGDEEIMLHEALDAARAGMVGVAHAGADLGLQRKGQAFLGAPGEVMQMAAHRPQKALGALEARRLLGRQHAQLDELGDIVDAVDVFGDPEQRVQVSEPALALLDIGFELIAAVADPLMARVALGELGFDELRRGAAQDLGFEPRLQLGVERLLAPHIARLEQRRADRQIGLGIAQALG